MRFVTLLLAFVAAASAQTSSLTDRYRAVSGRLIDASLADAEGYKRLEYLCYRIGNRLSGSASLDRAVQWSAEQMKAAGLSNVQIIPAMVPHWVRGAESARMIAPLDKPLHMLGLGGSVSTPPGGITAEVVVVPDFDALTALNSEKIRGKIVVYNEEYHGYGPSRVYRTSGASRAAELGAVAALVRSATPLAMQIPHTGNMAYDEKFAKIPTASISPEDAMMLARLTGESVTVRVRLEMGAQTLPDVESGAGEITE